MALNLQPLHAWFSKNVAGVSGNIGLRVWFWFVGVVGLLPILFRVFRYSSMIDIFGTGELLIVATLVCGAAVERSLSGHTPLITGANRTRSIDCMSVCIVLMIVSCSWYGYLENQVGPSKRVIWPSITIALGAYVLGGMVVSMDASHRQATAAAAAQPKQGDHR